MSVRTTWQVGQLAKREDKRTRDAHGQEAVRGSLALENVVRHLCKCAGWSVGAREGGKRERRAHLLRHGARAVTLGHRLDTGTNAHVNLARGNLESDVVDRNEARRALAVDGRDRRGRGEAGSELGHAGDGRTTAGREDVADLDLLDEGLVDTRALNDTLEDSLEEVLRAGVLEATLLGARDRGADGTDDDDVVRALLEEGGLATRGEVRHEAREAVLGGGGGVGERPAGGRRPKGVSNRRFADGAKWRMSGSHDVSEAARVSARGDGGEERRGVASES